MTIGAQKKTAQNGTFWGVNDYREAYFYVLIQLVLYLRNDN